MKEYVDSEDPTAQASETAVQHAQEGVELIASMMPGKMFPPGRLKAAVDTMEKALVSTKMALDANSSSVAHRPLEESLDGFATAMHEDINTYLADAMSDIVHQKV